MVIKNCDHLRQRLMHILSLLLVAAQGKKSGQVSGRRVQAERIVLSVGEC